MLLAGVAELVDALDLGSSDESCGGSSPSARTKRQQRLRMTNSGGPGSKKGILALEGTVRRPPVQALKPRADQIDTVRRSGRTKREED
jgi:hypothetical protein